MAGIWEQLEEASKDKNPPTKKADNKWIKLTKGIRYRKHPTRKAGKGVKMDRYFSIYYRLDDPERNRGKKSNQINEGLGWESEGWSEEKVRIVYSELKHNRQTGVGPKTYQEKKALEEEKQSRVKAEKKLKEIEAITFSELFKQYLPIAEGDKSAKSIKREKHIFRDHIEPVIGSMQARGITKFHIEDIKRIATEKGLAPGSINIILATTRQILKFGIQKDILKGVNPVSLVKKPKADNRRIRFLTRDEADRLLRALKVKSEEVYRMALFSLHMGLRAKEIFNLAWGDIDTENELIFIKDTKSGHNRFSYMTPKVKAEIEAMPKGKASALLFPPREDGKHDRIQLISKTFFRTVNDLELNEGVTDVRQKVVFHTLRHTFASWLVDKGVSIYHVKDLLGHQTLTMTERYAKVSEDTLRQAIEVLSDTGKEIPLNRATQ